MALSSYQVRAVAHVLDRAEGDPEPKPPTNDELTEVVARALGAAFPEYRFSVSSERLDK